MGRKATFDKAGIARAALELLAIGGPQAATIAAIADRLGAPTGSIYHRYDSRATLLADLWLGTVEPFQAGLIAALAGEDVRRAGVEAALYTPRWVAEHPLEARLLLLHRREELVGEEWPAEVRARAERLGRAAQAAFADYARRRWGRAGATEARRIRFAVVDVPYGALRRYVAEGRTPPPDVAELVARAAAAALET